MNEHASMINRKQNAISMSQCSLNDVVYEIGTTSGLRIDIQGNRILLTCLQVYSDYVSCSSRRDDAKRS
jgi:hypothetical protein